MLAPIENTYQKKIGRKFSYLVRTIFLHKTFSLLLLVAAMTIFLSTYSMFFPGFAVNAVLNTNKNMNINTLLVLVK